MRSRDSYLQKLSALLVIVGGFSVFALSLLRVEFSALEYSIGLLGLASIFAGARAGLKIPGASPSDHVPLFYLFIFIGLLLFDHSPVIVLASLAGCYASLRQDRTLLQTLYDSAAPALSTFLIYEALNYGFGSSANAQVSYNLLISLGLICATQSAFHLLASALKARQEAEADVRVLSPRNLTATFITYLLLAGAACSVAKLPSLLSLPVSVVVASLCGGIVFVYLLVLLREAVAVKASRPREARPKEVKAAELADRTTRHATAADQDKEEIFRHAFESFPIAAALISPKGKCVKVNRSLCELLGYGVEELESSSLQNFVCPDDLSKLQASLAQIARGETSACQIEKRFISKGGQEVWATCDISGFRGGKASANYIVVQVQDITTRRQAEEALLHNAFHDALTGLPNRVLFVDHLELAINRTQRNEGQIYAVLFIDLDRFKIINDSLGHLIGDKLLVGVAQRLSSCLRPGDTIARVGGDEFTVLLEDLVDESEAVSIAHRIQNELSVPFTFEGREVFTTISIGVAPSSPGYSNPSDILRDADTAMYRAKLLGKNRYEIFDKAMHEVAVDLLQMETDLRHALERGEFFIQYQPIVSLDNFRLRGFEALVRWRHPERGLISPLDFVPVAEDTGQIIPIGEWVLRKACKQMQQWQKRYGMEQSLFISVNLSGKQFAQQDLVEQIKEIIAETKLNPRGLKLEITESMVMENIDTATGMLHQLRDLGVQLSIDDFGTGYSSLSYLHRFPIDTLKIDRSFVIKMIDNNENIEIVRTIIMLAQNLGMDVIAEGVETREQLMMLRKLKCENGQGYYFSKPLEKSDAENLLLDVCAEGNPFKKVKQQPQPKPEPVMNTRVKSIKLGTASDMI